MNKRSQSAIARHKKATLEERQALTKRARKARKKLWKEVNTHARSEMGRHAVSKRWGQPTTTQPKKMV